MGRMQAEVTMRPGDVLFLKSLTPHQVETASDYSMHMSFDIVDKHIGVDVALNMVIDEYKKDCAPCYTPTSGALQKALGHARSDEFQRRLAEFQVHNKRAYQQARELLASNRVKALDRWIA